MVRHYDIRLRPRERGIHLITGEVMQAVEEWPPNGLMHLFIRHTSAGLALNENADPSVRRDMEAWFDRAAREGESYYTHTFEGPDDMPAHIKSVICGSSLSIPIVNGRPGLGTWQGIYLCEFRDRGGSRSLTLSLLS